MKQKKVQLTIRLDEAVLNYYKDNYQNYQTQINTDLLKISRANNVGNIASNIYTKLKKSKTNKWQKFIAYLENELELESSPDLFELTEVEFLNYYSSDKMNRAYTALFEFYPNIRFDLHYLDGWRDQLLVVVAINEILLKLGEIIREESNEKWFGDNTEYYFVYKFFNINYEDIIELYNEYFGLLLLDKEALNYEVEKVLDPEDVIGDVYLANDYSAEFITNRYGFNPETFTTTLHKSLSTLAKYGNNQPKTKLEDEEYKNAIDLYLKAMYSKVITHTYNENKNDLIKLPSFNVYKMCVSDALVIAKQNKDESHIDKELSKYDFITEGGFPSFMKYLGYSGNTDIFIIPESLKNEPINVFNELFELKLDSKIDYKVFSSRAK